ncbi:phenylacetate--CoA ligase family protein [Candidatus Pacearchaeota archaeon]|nr:phenylacetate--CoA ligase family protein [Candidatus Pacearchaeota archaeon]
MMSGVTHKIYYKLPYFAKKWMASLNSRKLERQRYGPEYNRILAQIAQRDKWSTDDFIEYQYRELRSLIQHAATNVPYYRNVFTDLGIKPQDFHGIEDLRRLPILEKQTMRENPESFVDESLDKRQLIIGHTSGTTGTPLVLYRSVWLNTAAFAYMDARSHSVAGMKRRTNKSVSICGHLVATPNRKRPPFWVHNRRWDQLYMSSYHLADEYLKYYVEELRKFKADYIEGYPSSIYSIAQYIGANRLEPIPFKACFTTAETLFDYQRNAFKKAFNCRTFDQYGCGEMVVFAAECEHGSMHLSPETGFVEVVDDNDQPVAVGQTGQLICTSLINRVQPFIRFRVGDVGSLRSEPCPCGRPLPILDSIEGRTDAVLITRDGRRIGRLDPVFKGVYGVMEAQIVQDDYDKFRIRIVPAKDYTEKDGKRAIFNLADRVGTAEIQVELVKQIERSSAGKFRAIVCNIGKEQMNNDE